MQQSALDLAAGDTLLEYTQEADQPLQIRHEKGALTNMIFQRNEQEVKDQKDLLNQNPIQRYLNPISYDYCKKT